MLNVLIIYVYYTKQICKKNNTQTLCNCWQIFSVYLFGWWRSLSSTASVVCSPISGSHMSIISFRSESCSVIVYWLLYVIIYRYYLMNGLSWVLDSPGGVEQRFFRSLSRFYFNTLTEASSTSCRKHDTTTFLDNLRHENENLQLTWTNY